MNYVIERHKEEVSASHLIARAHKVNIFNDSQAYWVCV